MTIRKSKSMKFLEEMTGGPLTLSELIRSIRLCEEMSQEEFSKKLKISTTHLCDIEKGRKTVSVERAARFAKILGYSQEQFIRLALQGILDKEGIGMKVSVEAA